MATAAQKLRGLPSCGRLAHMHCSGLKKSARSVGWGGVGGGGWEGGVGGGPPGGGQLQNL